MNIQSREVILEDKLKKAIKFIQEELDKANQKAEKAQMLLTDLEYNLELSDGLEF